MHVMLPVTHLSVNFCFIPPTLLLETAVEAVAKVDVRGKGLPKAARVEQTPPAQALDTVLMENQGSPPFLFQVHHPPPHPAVPGCFAVTGA